MHTRELIILVGAGMIMTGAIIVTIHTATKRLAQLGSTILTQQMIQSMNSSIIVQEAMEMRNSRISGGPLRDKAAYPLAPVGDGEGKGREVERRRHPPLDQV